jgi:spoIIIJ-associated protein
MPDVMETELKARARTWAEGLAAASGLDVRATVAADEPDGVTLAFEGPDAHWLVGRHGQVLDALQYLASLGVNRGAGQRLRVLFDADGYRARREATLKKLAHDLAAQVKSTGQEAVLDPLSPLERRIVHTALADDPAVKTYSEGEEPERYVIISPA